MIRVLRFLLAAFVIAAFAAPPAPAEEAPPAGPEIGKAAPDFTLTGADGASYTLSSYKGKTVVLEWTNHECPFVRKHYESGNMQALQEEAGADGVVWLSIVSSAPGMQGHTTPEEARAVIEKTGAKAAARLLDPDGTVGRLYGAKTTPHMFVIDSAGVLVYMGAIDDNPSPRPETVASANNYVRAALAALKDGKKPEVTQTNPYGCSVKYQTM